MNKYAKKLAALCTAAALLFSSSAVCVSAAGTDAKALGSLADSYQAQNGTFTLSTASRIFVVGSAAPTGDLLQTVQLAQRQFAAAEQPSGAVMEIVWGPESYAKIGDIVVKLDTASGIPAEGYQLAVSDTATVTASDVDGLLYGLNMLQKYFRADGDMSLSGFIASDTPDTKERTVSLDCGRKYYTAEWIENFVRQISWMGYNTLELHFSEDGGFRADFWDKEYYTDNYSPENDFTWLCGSHVQSWVKDPYRTDPDAGKYLTTAELVQICKVAKEYHIDIIPSFDSPAHMDYITWKFEQNYKSNTSYSFTYSGTTYKASSTKGCINYTGKTGASTPTWPYYTTIDITDGTMAKAFVFALYSDIADFFKEYAGSTDFSIGADEVNLSSGYGIKWSYSAFPGYVNELNRMLNKKGYTCRIFNDFIGSTTYNQSSAKAIYDFDDNIEIMYWNSDFNPTTGKWDEPIWHVKFFWENNTGSTDNWGDGGRILYNCIQTNCYYVLRVAASNTSYPNMDARNPENYNWTFYHSTEENIYNEWYPADISEKGLYTENAADVPADQLGGAYFLIWNDYAALNTEAEVWNGVKDNTGTSSSVYSLFNRMWSNITKMWNSDINSTVNYDSFASVREKFGYFPGFTSCSKDASLPDASTPTQAYLADHNALTAALAVKIDKGNYTDDSYAAYETAYNEAAALNQKYDATAEEIAAAITKLNNAKKALKENASAGGDDEVEVYDINIELKTKVNGEEKVIKTVGTNYSSNSVYLLDFYLEPLTGYSFDRVEGSYTFIHLASKDGSGFLRGYVDGTSSTSAAITVWYSNEPDTSYLNALAADAYTSNSYGFTDASWETYQNALTAANNFSITKEICQEDVDKVVFALIDAANALETSDSDNTIKSIQKISAASKYGRQITLRITTTPDVASLTVTRDNDNDVQPLTQCLSKVQTLNDNSVVKVWLISFSANFVGTENHTITAETTSETIPLTVYN